MSNAKIRRIVGQALASFDPAARGKIEELEAKRLGRRLPVNNGASAVVSRKRIRSQKDLHTRINEWWIERIESDVARAPSTNGVTPYADPLDYDDDDSVSV
jgi:hypothetical protein